MAALRPRTNRHFSQKVKRKVTPSLARFCVSYRSAQADAHCRPGLVRVVQLSDVLQIDGAKVLRPRASLLASAHPRRKALSHLSASRDRFGKGFEFIGDVVAHAEQLLSLLVASLTPQAKPGRP
jgi:hypothetical protein